MWILQFIFKENVSIYLNDNVNYILNITSVNLTSYSDVSSSPARATLIPTQITLPTKSSKVAFSILANTDLQLSSVIQKGSFSNYEKQLIASSIVSFRVVRSTLFMKNINAIREYVDYYYQAIFCFLIFLQDKTLDIRDMDFNITGLAIVSYDPLNVYIENILMDVYALRNGIVFRTYWNYPGASLTGTFYANNLTVVTTSDRLFVDNPSILYYAGPANYTANNMNLTDHYVTANNPKGSLMYSITTDWNPADYLSQYVNMNVGSFSVVNNPTGIKYSTLVVFLNANPYRTITANITNQLFMNYQNAYTSMILSYGTPNHIIYISNCTFSNYSLFDSAISFSYFKKVIMNNLSFKNTDYLNVASIYLAKNYDVELSNISFENHNGTTATSKEFILLNNLASTNTYFSNLSLKNWFLRKTELIYNAVSLNSITIINGVFSGVYLSSGGKIFSTGTIQQIIFKNNTFTNIMMLDSADESSTILKIDSLDLNSTYDSIVSELTVTTSEVSAILFGGFVNAPSILKTLTVSDVSYLNSYFSTSRNLISTNNIEINANVSMNFVNLTFSNITFKYSGNLFQAMHQLPTNVSISNSTFTSLQAAWIVVEASNKQNINLLSNLVIYNSIFTNIDDEYSSLLNVNEGGVLYISNSQFSNIYWYEEGAVLFSGYQKSVTIISNSIFQNNTAMTGVIFEIESESVVKWYTIKKLSNTFWTIYFWKFIIVKLDNGFFTTGKVI